MRYSSSHRLPSELTSWNDVFCEQVSHFIFSVLKYCLNCCPPGCVSVVQSSLVTNWKYSFSSRPKTNGKQKNMHQIMFTAIIIIVYVVFKGNETFRLEMFGPDWYFVLKFSAPNTLSGVDLGMKLNGASCRWGWGGGVGGFRATLRPTIGPGQSPGRGPGARPLFYRTM